MIEKAHQIVAGSPRGTRVGSPHMQEFSLKVVCSRVRKFKQHVFQCFFDTHGRFSVMNWIMVAEIHRQQCSRHGEVLATTQLWDPINRVA